MTFWLQILRLCRNEKAFLKAKKKGFNPEKNAQEFSEWDITLNDGLD